MSQKLTVRNILVAITLVTAVIVLMPFAILGALVFWIIMKQNKYETEVTKVTETQRVENAKSQATN